MDRKIITAFSVSAAVILFVAGAAKILSAFGSANILLTGDPLFGVGIRYLLMICGTAEIIISFNLFLKKTNTATIVLLAWFSTNLLIYRIGLGAIGWYKPCNCLGVLTDAIYVSSHAADIAMKCVLIYLLIGSYAILFHYWRKRNAKREMQNTEAGAEKVVEH